MRRWFSLCLLCLFLFSCVGCGDGNESSAPAVSELSAEHTTAGAPQSFSVAFSREDTLNPFAAATEVNLTLAGLLYDSLTVIDASFTPKLSLAREMTLQDATHVAVILKDGVLFSDGTSLQGADVVASFQQAKTSGNYGALLANVASARVDRYSGNVIFTLHGPDPQYAACLSFPIVKGNTLTTNPGEAPLGSGLYVLEQTDNGPVLAANPARGQELKYDTIGLRHLPNSETVYYGFTSGGITAYFDDLSHGEPRRVSGTSVGVDMNALLYLGCNGGSEILSNAAVRQALSMLMDRDALASSGFSGWAKAATTPFHPTWSTAKELIGVSATRDLSGAVKLLGEAGYGTGVDQSRLTLELIYSHEGGFRSALADMVASQLRSAGMEVLVTPLSYEEYMNRLNAGQYDLYLGEVRLPANMHLGSLMPGGSVAYGVAADSAGATAYGEYLAGEKSMQEFTDAFLEDMPYIPLCWRNGFMAYDRRLTKVTPHGYNPFYGFADWY